MHRRCGGWGMCLRGFRFSVNKWVTPGLLPTLLLQASGRMENVVGWYHSHPGYGCWLSGIDVGTQMTNQKYQVGLSVGVAGAWCSCADGLCGAVASCLHT